MDSLQNIMWKVNAGCELTPAQVRELSALVSLGFNTRGRIDRDYALRSDILAAMPVGCGLRVKEICERNAKVGDYSVQKVSAALKALVWAGVVERTEIANGEKITVKKCVDLVWDENLRWYRHIFEDVEIEVKTAIFTRII